MTIIDSNGFLNRFRLSQKLDELRTEKEFYVQEIDKVTIDKEKFESNEEILEKYAREEYLMKKESEDIFYVKQE
jgi:cell division protein FtsB|tara:strand:- start:90 stop:311 length:222 start_codon:yes stop_codon:yes gene_type:complete